MTAVACKEPVTAGSTDIALPLAAEIAAGIGIEVAIAIAIGFAGSAKADSDGEVLTAASPLGTGKGPHARALMSIGSGGRPFPHRQGNPVKNRDDQGADCPYAQGNQNLGEGWGVFGNRSQRRRNETAHDHSEALVDP